VATLEPVSRLNSAVFPLLGRPTSPIFTKRHATIAGEMAVARAL
jgi:hypothetical protein